MLIIQPNNTNIYLPIFTSLIFSWVPSPMNNKNIQTQLETLTTQVKLAHIKIDEIK